jgi:Ser/Thr protein kinase RdoA (MazF antagonist)
MMLEYGASDGARIGGQWFGDPRQLDDAATATAQSATTHLARVGVFPQQGVLLHVGGADAALPGLAELVASPGATLLVHRPENRAVVRLERSEGRCYAKVVRPERVESLAAIGRAAKRLAGNAFSVPELLEVDDSAGVIVWSALPGIRLRELLFATDGRTSTRATVLYDNGGPQNQAIPQQHSTEDVLSAVQAVGRALRALHSAPPPPNTHMHTSAGEIRRLEIRLKRVRMFAPHMYEPCRRAASGIFEDLIAGGSPLVLVHRDFNDTQILIDDDGRVGLLDFDSLSVGEAALDLANFIVHLEVRVLMGRFSAELARKVTAALLEGYGADADVYHRLRAYADAVHLRRACKKALAPRKAHAVPAALGWIGQPGLWHP